jgi:hypothetical protein
LVLLIIIIMIVLIIAVGIHATQQQCVSLLFGRSGRLFLGQILVAAALDFVKIHIKVKGIGIGIGITIGVLGSHRSWM